MKSNPRPQPVALDDLGAAIAERERETVAAQAITTCEAEGCESLIDTRYSRHARCSFHRTRRY